MLCCNNWFRNRRRHGFTLIEVLAGLVLLGSLLATVTLAKARYTRQLSLAARQLEAVKVADSILSQWWQESPDTIPRDGNGQVTTELTEADLSWRTHPLDIQSEEQIGYTIVRFELYDQQQPESQPPLVTVDLAISEPIEESTESETIQPADSIDPNVEPTDEP